jgi:hypothetical protein
VRLLRAEEHRAMVRTQLRALLEVGINPLSFFDRDYKKYFYLAGEQSNNHKFQVQLTQSSGKGQHKVPGLVL